MPDPYYDRWSGGPEIGPYDPTDDTRRDFLEPPEGRNEPPPAGSEHGERLGPDDVGLPRDEASGQTDPPPPEPPALMLDFEISSPDDPDPGRDISNDLGRDDSDPGFGPPPGRSFDQGFDQAPGAASAPATSAPAAGTAPATAKPPERCL